MTVRLPCAKLILVLAAALLNVSVARAVTFQPGDIVTYSQIQWGDPTSSAATLLTQKFVPVYGGGVEIGDASVGRSLLFTSPQDVITFLPQESFIFGIIASSEVNPTSSTAEIAAGLVLSFRLNIDLGDAGFIPNASGVNYGDLVFAPNYFAQFAGMSVREFTDLANRKMIGDGSYSSEFFDAILGLETAFVDGAPSDFAQNYLLLPQAIPVPEPAPWGLLIAGLGAFGWAMRKSRQQETNMRFAFSH